MHGFDVCWLAAPGFCAGAFFCGPVCENAQQPRKINDTTAAVRNDRQSSFVASMALLKPSVTTRKPRFPAEVRVRSRRFFILALSRKAINLAARACFPFQSSFPQLRSLFHKTCWL